MLDGQIARRTKTQSKLGQIADSEADFCLYLAITFILIQNNVLPYWLGVVMLLRFLVPLLAALASYFLFAQPVRFAAPVALRGILNRMWLGDDGNSHRGGRGWRAIGLPWKQT